MAACHLYQIYHGFPYKKIITGTGAGGGGGHFQFIQEYILTNLQCTHTQIYVGSRSFADRNEKMVEDRGC